MLFEKQDYQEQCVSNIIEVLRDYDFDSNDSAQLFSSINEFYKTNSIPIKDKINQVRLDVEMETGTGKTFTYIKTIFELNKQYKQNKFIIFVPRKAIREGVIQNIELTADYFFQEYGKRISLYTYDSKVSIGKIKHHYLKNKDELSVLILTNSSIDKKETNIIHKYQEDLFGDESTFHSLQKLNPVLIIDEPHLLKGEAFSSIFKEFNSLCFRFGATFPKEEQHKLSNMIYSLDSITSFKQYLVKKIRVNTIITDESKLKVNTVTSKDIKLLYFQDNEEKQITVSKTEDIGIKTGISQYNGVSVVNISVKDKKVYLSNGIELSIEDKYELSEDEIRLMIRKTIENHFQKEESFFVKGVKTLSLFFIPSIADYRGNEPRVKKIFEDEYKIQRLEILNKTDNEEYKKYLSKDIDDNGNLTVHEGYFSGDKGNTNDDKIASGIDLILKDKESLLSFDTSLRFIFSVWALQEGWDNPNVFNICKLANTDKETSRRQQIGRGLRLCVNQEGKRLTYKYCNENQEEFYNFNVLDVIVSGKEKNFIEEIQSEILANSHTLYLEQQLSHTFFTELGLDKSQSNRLETLLEDNNIIKVEDEHYNIIGNISEFVQNHKDDVLKCKIDEKLYNKLYQELHDIETKSIANNTEIVENGNKTTSKVSIKKDKLELFKELWETINRKSKIVYANIQEDSIIDDIAKTFNAESITPIYTRFEVKEYNAHLNRVENKITENKDKIQFLQDKRYKEFVLEFIKKEHLPLDFVIKLFNKLDKQKLYNNPTQSKTLLKQFIKDKIHAGVLQSVEYQLEGFTQITSLHDDDGSYKSEIKSNALGRFCADDTPRENFLYDTIVYDSNFEKAIMLNDQEQVDDYKITVFAKLPKISIPTPYKHYNPDFAYLMNTSEGKTLFLVVESKGYNSENEIPPDEMMKINYAEKFFEKLQKELPNIKIIFKKRINRQDLASLLDELRGE